MFIAVTLAVGSHDARRAMEGGQGAACGLLKLPEPKPFTGGSSDLVDAARAAAGPRALQLALAVLLGAYEGGTSRDSWRRPTGDTIAYFTALRNWHYPLSDVEQLVLGRAGAADEGDGPQDVDGIEPGAAPETEPATAEVDGGTA